ncbi:tRNA dihydrouridine synthase [Desulfohalobium retbaense]|uniref:tRNA-dihydrouridine synthase n=1 Tax=Desulfohalobium retbaense (strain ATCC 49708 / DSM 5692 / JCM 16813 / HR100) TaxID=485915 RepID=C8X244_DESRD|nr:tRNA-dihydrouridine synthase family protein [Desulfohalobium retbaense]ACV68367.1 dihydrouridine synthase DuS [Desulfohalobium retbaense DSM 5692]
MTNVSATGPSPLPFGPQAPWLAPLAGFTDLPFRLLCRENGARVAHTEMISVKGLIYNSQGTWDLLATAPADTPLVVQLFGADPDCFAQPVRWLTERGFHWIDLNAGCPVRKVIKTGAGAALMEDPQRLVRIMQTIGRAAPVQAGVKLRLPADGSTDGLLRLRDTLARAGVSWITLHPRTARQGYGGLAQWSALSRMAESSPVPIVASGDLWNAQAARRCFEQTGVDGIMFARGALHNPRIFKADLATGAEEDPCTDTASIAALVRRHGQLCRRYDPSRSMLLKMRSFIPRYVKGFPGAKQARKGIIACQDWEAFEQYADQLEEALAGQ